MGKRRKYAPELLERLRHNQQQSLTRDLTTYASLIGQSFATKIDSLAKVIGDIHHPSLGTYKERLLASVIRTYIPTSFSVGTGFVLFPREKPTGTPVPVGFDQLNQSDFEVSKQCDILVYDSATFPVVFQDGDFVVLRPESVRAVIEVKGALDNEEIDSIVDHCIDFGRKWNRCRAFYREHHQKPDLSNPMLCAMAWRVDVDDKGLPKTDGSRLRKRIAAKYKEKIAISELRLLPVLSHAYIYNECCVSFATSISGESADLEVGWMTTPGQFVRVTGPNSPRYDGERTIASLLATVHLSIDSTLDESFNRFFSYMDETRASLLPYEHEGFTVWIDDQSVVNTLFKPEDDEAS
jgi:hypothetical protein